MNLSEKYTFRSIREEEAEQAAEIEQICFPPAEAISREDIIEPGEKNSGAVSGSGRSGNRKAGRISHRLCNR